MAGKIEPLKNQDPTYMLQFTNDFMPLHRPLLLKSRRFAGLTAPAQLLYLRLTALADKWGRYTADHAEIHHQVYGRTNQYAQEPVDTAAMDAMMTELDQAGFIEYYHAQDARNVDGEPMQCILLRPHWTCREKGRTPAQKWPKHPSQPNVTYDSQDRTKSKGRAVSGPPEREREGEVEVEVERERERETAGSADQDHATANGPEPDETCGCPGPSPEEMKVHYRRDEEAYYNDPATHDEYLRLYVAGGRDSCEFHPPADVIAAYQARPDTPDVIPAGLDAKFNARHKPDDDNAIAAGDLDA